GLTNTVKKIPRNRNLPHIGVFFRLSPQRQGEASVAQCYRVLIRLWRYCRWAGASTGPADERSRYASRDDQPPYLWLPCPAETPPAENLREVSRARSVQ